MRPVLLVALSLAALGLGPETPSSPAHQPAYTEDGRLLPQRDYREWVYLSSGLDMSYTPRGTSAMNGHAQTHAQSPSQFDNVFVNPEAYRSFLQAGTWPDKTTLVLEVRGAESNASINQAGRSQGRELLGVEVHVKDQARGGWSFYEFSGPTPAKRVPQEAECYACHRDHAAVDTTFVQFYPTLLPLAEQKHTLSTAYGQAEAKRQGR